MSKELEARIAKLEQWNAKIGCTNYGLRRQLAVAQADNQRLREALDTYLAANDPSEFGCACDLSVGHLCGPCFAEKQQCPLREALSTPIDTSALEAIVRQAGEVMRERCNRSSVDRIQYLPGVTLEDLK